MAGAATLGSAAPGYRHIVRVLSQLDHTATAVVPRVHLVIALLKRSILGTHQGSVSLQHLVAYLEEFAFRCNRRRARRITHGTARLLGIAIVTPPRPFWKIVGLRLPKQKRDSLHPPDGYEDPFRLFLEGVLWIAHTGAPWRELPAPFGK